MSLLRGRSVHSFEQITLILNILEDQIPMIIFKNFAGTVTLPKEPEKSIFT